MAQQIFTLREAREACRELGFSKSRIWWNKMAADKKFKGAKVRINGRTCWSFTIDEINRIVKERPLLHAKKIVAAIIAAFLICGQAQASMASYYSTKDACGAKTNNHPGCPTASGRGLFDLEREGALFCASNDYPLGTKLKVTNLNNNKSVVVTVLDRGGFKKYGRDIDLGKKAFQQIANGGRGVIPVTIDEV